MIVAEPVTTPRRSDPSYCRRAFGIEIQSSMLLPGATAAASEARRATVLEHRPTREVDRAWRTLGATRVLERRRRDGRLVMAVDQHSDLGYRVHAPRNGRHHVSADGKHVLSALPEIAPWRWQRLLFAQVLPLAATLHGLDLLHASAVAWNGRALGFVAAAGTGKTSVAAHLVASGGVLLTDDVLALEEVEGAIVAHPGVASLSIDPAELRRVPTEGRIRLGRVLGRSDKLILAAGVADLPRRLDRLYFLERPVPGEIRISPLDPDPVLLLANAFNTYVRTPERVVNQLSIAASVAETVALFSVRIPAGVTAAEVARAVVAHAEST
jgi:hypothetical protein